MLVLAVAAANALLGNLPQCKGTNHGQATSNCPTTTPCSGYYGSSNTGYWQCSEYAYDSSCQGTSGQECTADSPASTTDASNTGDFSPESTENPLETTEEEPTTVPGDRFIALVQKAEINDEKLVFDKLDFDNSMSGFLRSPECVAEEESCDAFTAVRDCSSAFSDCDEKYEIKNGFVKVCAFGTVPADSSEEPCKSSEKLCTFTLVDPAANACGPNENFISENEGSPKRGDEACAKFEDDETGCNAAFAAGLSTNDYRKCTYDTSTGECEITSNVENFACSTQCTTQVSKCEFIGVGQNCIEYHDAKNQMCIKPWGGDSKCVAAESSVSQPWGCIPDQQAMRHRRDTSCKVGEKQIFKFPDFEYGGMIVAPGVDATDKTRHENFYFGDGETKYDDTRTALTFEKISDEKISVKISHPLVREYPVSSRVYFWEEDHPWIPDRKELHTDVSSDDTKIKIVKENDGRKPLVGDVIALHSATHAINRTIVGVTEVATANGDPHYEVELNAAVGADFSAGSTHVKLHEVSESRKSGDDDDGLSDAELGGIIGGSIGGVLLLAVVAKQMMPTAGYNALDNVA